MFPKILKLLDWDKVPQDYAQEVPQDYEQVRRRALQNLFEMPNVRLAMPECAALDVDPGTVLDTDRVPLSSRQITNLRYSVQSDTVKGLIEKHGEEILFYNLADVVATIGAKIINTEDWSSERKRPYPHQGYDMRKSGKSYFLYRDGPTVWAICVHGPQRPGMRSNPYLDWYDRVRTGCWYVEMCLAKEVEFTSSDIIYRLVQETEEAQVTSTKESPIIDCDAEPTITRAKIVSHRKHGKFTWGPRNVGLYQSTAWDLHSHHGPIIMGDALIGELREKRVPILNACVLHWLLEHQDQVPEEWKDKIVWFLGTIYHNHRRNYYDRRLITGLRWTSFDDWELTSQPPESVFTTTSYVAIDDSISL